MKYEKETFHAITNLQKFNEFTFSTFVWERVRLVIFEVCHSLGKIRSSSSDGAEDAGLSPTVIVSFEECDKLRLRLKNRLHT